MRTTTGSSIGGNITSSLQLTLDGHRAAFLCVGMGVAALVLLLVRASAAASVAQGSARRARQRRGRLHGRLQAQAAAGLTSLPPTRVGQPGA